MGKSLTPKYVLQMEGSTDMCWDTKWAKANLGSILPTVKQLEEFVMAYVVSTYPGYVNEHLGQAFGITIPSYARIKMNGELWNAIIEWRAPNFMVLPDAADYPNVARSPKPRFQSAIKESLHEDRLAIAAGELQCNGAN